MNRSFSVLFALLLVYAALAAPAPHPFPAGLGKPIDPDKNCKFRHDKSSLTIEMPGTVHDYDPLRERANAPRLLRDLEGDFEIQVRVRIECQPSANSTSQGQPSVVAAGLLIIPPDGFPVTCIRFEYGLSPKGSGTHNYTALKTRDVKRGQTNALWDSDYVHWPVAEKTEKAYLKLKRRGTVFYPYLSPDGENWTLLVGGAGFKSLPAKIKVGLAAYTSSTNPSKVRFEQIKLTQEKKKER